MKKASPQTPSVLRHPSSVLRPPSSVLRHLNGGGGRTRTYEGVSQRIYSPPPLPLGTLPRTVSRIRNHARYGAVYGERVAQCQPHHIAYHHHASTREAQAKAQPTQEGQPYRRRAR